jgi:hypothetical protein
MLGQALPAQPPRDVWRNWSNVPTLQTGQKIAVETRQPKQKLNALFLSSNEAGITIQTAGGERTIARTDVYRIRSIRGARRALAIGAASGVGVYALMAPRGDLVASAHLVFGAAFAGIGTLVGWAVGCVGRFELIYEASATSAT